MRLRYIIHLYGIDKMIKNTPPSRLLAIDPGKDTGWCLFINGEIANFGICRGLEELLTFIENEPKVDIVVMEEFRLFHSKALQQSGSRLETVEAEGIVRSWAWRNKVKLVLQLPKDPLKLGQMWSGVAMPKNHKNSHGISALYHGVYYLVKNGMREIHGT